MAEYTPTELEALTREQHAHMCAARAKVRDMLTELAVLVDWLVTSRAPDGCRQHLRVHEILTLLSHGLGDD